MKSGIWSGSRRAYRPALAAGLLFILGIVPTRPAGADVMDWMNRQLGGMFGDEGPKAKADAARMDGYLRRLQEPPPSAAGGWTSRTVDRLAGPPASLAMAEPASIRMPIAAATARRSPPAAAFVARETDWSPKLGDALQALTSPPGTAPGLEPLEASASRAALLAAKAGFTLPAQVLFNLGRATEPLRRLLVSCREGLHDASSAASLDRLHRACQRLMGQIQNNHQLAQLSRELIDSGAGLLERGRAPVSQGLERAPQIQAVPLVAAFGEVTLRARGNLESARGYLGRAQADLRSAFQLTRSALLHVEQIKEKSFQSSASTFTLEDQPQSLDRLLGALDRIKEGVTRAMEGMQTAHGLLYVNQKALLELLYSLKPQASLRAHSVADGRTMASAFQRASASLSAGLETAGVELARQKQWRTSLEAYKTPLFELGPLPDWVFSRDTILVSPSRPGSAAGSLPDIARVIASLEQEPEQSIASQPSAPQLPATMEMPLIDLEGRPLPSSPASEKSSSPEDSAYRLPSWY